MRSLKRISAFLLTAALLAGLCVTNVCAAGEVSTFTDITDPVVGEAVESLREMGVLHGLGDGTFNPSGTLTRAEFCTMAVLAMGRGDEVAAQSHRTIFTDVTSRHWARGYVNLAVNIDVDGVKLIAGTGNGSFSPDRPITYAEAATILLRVLGYGQEANDNWPRAVKGLANTVGLNSDIGSVTENSGITRAQAAILFRNLLLSHPKGSSGTYVGSISGYNAQAGVILLSVDAKTADGSLGVLTSAGDEAAKPAVSAPASFFLGKRGTAVYDDKGLFLTFLPDPGSAGRSLTVELATPTSITGTDGTVISVPSSATVLRDGITAVYGEVYQGLNRPGLALSVFFTAAGAVDYIYVPGATGLSGDVLVAGTDGIGAFDALTGGDGSVSVVRNGSPALPSDIKTNDVGVYSPGSGVLYVTDFRLSAVLESTSPNLFAPTSVRLLGKDYEVLESAYASLAGVKLGSVVTALFTPNGKIAKLVPYGSVGATTRGVVTEYSEDQVTVALLGAPYGLETVSGPLYGSALPQSFVGYVVLVSGVKDRSGGEERICLSLTRQSGTAVGDVDVDARTVGGVPLASGAIIYERVASGPVTRIALSDVTLGTVPASKVSYAHRNAAGDIDVLILNDVTGDCYRYGFVESHTETTANDPDFGEINNIVTSVTDSAGTLTVVGSGNFNIAAGGVAESLNSSGRYKSAAGFMPLTEVRNVTQLNFDSGRRTCTVNGLTFPIASNVQCYDRSTGTWFDSLALCLIHTNSFTVYYDRSPSEGGKVRIIIAE